MGIFKGTEKFLKARAKSRHQKSKADLLKHLKKLKQLEAKLWGVTVKHLSNGEEQILEDTNHLIHMLNNNHAKLISSVNKKHLKELLNDLRVIKEDFAYLRRQIREKNKLKNLISGFTIRLVEKENYSKLENIFLLEAQLYEVVDNQEEELNKISGEIRHLQIDPESNKLKSTIEHLTKIRNLLAGHMDHHVLWDEEKQGFSNTSNILSALLKEVEHDL